MDSIAAFDNETAASLTTYLAGAERPEGTMRYQELAGFLFAIACAPELIAPSEWLPVIWGDDQSTLPFADLATAQRVSGQIMSLYNHVVAGVNDEQPTLPPGCEMRSEAMANFGEDSPLAMWSLGFLDGLHYLEELWQAYSDADAALAEELDYVVVPLIFFASREGAEAMHGDSGSDETFESAVQAMAEIFPDAMLEYASIAHALVEAAHTPAVSNKVARNGPCPCGSGRKYKKCCGRG